MPKEQVLQEFLLGQAELIDLLLKQNELVISVILDLIKDDCKFKLDHDQLSKELEVLCQIKEQAAEAKEAAIAAGMKNKNRIIRPFGPVN